MMYSFGLPQLLPRPPLFFLLPPRRLKGPFFTLSSPTVQYRQDSGDECAEARVKGGREGASRYMAKGEKGTNR